MKRIDVNKGIFAEKIVCDDLKRRGFLVTKPRKSASENGIDVVAIKDGVALLVEVKSVLFSKKAVKIKPVQKAGKQCDVIAIVYDKTVIYQPMSDHLKLCTSKCGTRGVTELIRLNKILAMPEEVK